MNEDDLFERTVGLLKEERARIAAKRAARLAQHGGLAPVQIFELRTAGGNAIHLEHRDDTNDVAIATAIVHEDEYRLGERPLTGWAIDIGAHIGTIAIALAKDNPALRVVAVEAVPENAEQVRRNVALNDLGDRVFVEAKAASNTDKAVEILYNYRKVGVPDRPHPEVDPEYVAQCRYIGNIFTSYPDDEMDTDRVSVEGLTLAGIIKKYQMDRVALLKIDCEGCEWTFFRSKALDKVDRIVGEYHDAGTFEQLVAMLTKTHTVEQWTDLGPVGLFGAVRR